MRVAIVALLAVVATPLMIQASESPILSADVAQLISREFSVSEEIVDRVVDLGLNHDDIIVAFHIAQRADMSPVHVATIRNQGDSWQEIADMRGLGPWDFYVMVNGEIESERYASILGKFGILPTSDWGKLPLRDSEIVDLVNLKFAASGYDYSVFEAMQLRDSGMDFSEVFREVRDRKFAMLEKQRQERRVNFAGTDSK